jgi:hypothetical protein
LLPSAARKHSALTLIELSNDIRRGPSAASGFASREPIPPAPERSIDLRRQRGDNPVSKSRFSQALYSVP